MNALPPFYAQIAAALKASPNGVVPDHGFTTWLGSPNQGARVVLSVLWHGPDSPEVKESVIYPDGSIETVRVTMMAPQQLLQLFYSYHETAEDFFFTGPVTYPEVTDHVAWLASKGINFPENHQHWHNKCLKTVREVLSQLGSTRQARRPLSNGGGSDPWSAIRSVTKGRYPVEVKPKTLQTRMQMLPGDKEFIDLVQDSPIMNTLLYFLSKKAPSGQITGMLVGQYIENGEESLISQVTGNDGDIRRIAGKGLTLA